MAQHSNPAAYVTSAPREPLSPCEQQRSVHLPPVFFAFNGHWITYCRLMIIDSRTMESEDEESLLGQEPEDEDSELSDNAVSELLTC